MLVLMNSFVAEEDGAVTVDWVILCAGVVSLALAAVGVITSGTEDLSGDVEIQMKNQLITTSFENDGSV